MPCTTILVGKKASYDGSTLMARNEDAGNGSFAPKRFLVVNPEDQPREYVSVLSGCRIELPDQPLRYTAAPNALPDKGIWGEAGINSCHVAMTATETITSNARVQGADPLVKDGIGEEDMLTIVLPYIRSAREGVELLGRLLEKYGTYEMNGVGFQDADEIWWMETIGGHHWIARRIPDDCYAVVPNQLGIDSLDLTDAFGEAIKVRTVAAMEIFAAKTNALISRAAARDLYDFNQMIDRNMFAEQTDLFRKSIIFYASISQEIISPSFGTDSIDNLTFQKIRRDLFPVLKQEERRQTFDLEGRKEAAKEFIHTLMIPTEEEIEYMNRFSQKEYRPELLFDDPSIIERIIEHPMALWKCKS